MSRTSNLLLSLRKSLLKRAAGPKYLPPEYREQIRCVERAENDQEKFNQELQKYRSMGGGIRHPTYDARLKSFEDYANKTWGGVNATVDGTTRTVTENPATPQVPSSGATSAAIPSPAAPQGSASVPTKPAVYGPQFDSPVIAPAAQSAATDYANASVDQKNKYIQRRLDSPLYVMRSTGQQAAKYAPIMNQIDRQAVIDSSEDKYADHYRETGMPSDYLRKNWLPDTPNLPFSKPSNIPGVQNPFAVKKDNFRPGYNYNVESSGVSRSPGGQFSGYSTVTVPGKPTRQYDWSKMTPENVTFQYMPKKGSYQKKASTTASITPPAQKPVPTASATDPKPPVGIQNTQSRYGNQGNVTAQRANALRQSAQNRQRANYAEQAEANLTEARTREFLKKNPNGTSSRTWGDYGTNALYNTMEFLGNEKTYEKPIKAVATPIELGIDGAMLGGGIGTFFAGPLGMAIGSAIGGTAGTLYGLYDQTFGEGNSGMYTGMIYDTITNNKDSKGWNLRNLPSWFGWGSKSGSLMKAASFVIHQRRLERLRKQAAMGLARWGLQSGRQLGNSLGVSVPKSPTPTPPATPGVAPTPPGATSPETTVSDSPRSLFKNVGSYKPMGALELYRETERQKYNGGFNHMDWVPNGYDKLWQEAFPTPPATPGVAPTPPGTMPNTSTVKVATGATNPTPVAKNDVRVVFGSGFDGRPYGIVPQTAKPSPPVQSDPINRSIRREAESEYASKVEAGNVMKPSSEKITPNPKKGVIPNKAPLKNRYVLDENPDSLREPSRRQSENVSAVRPINPNIAIRRDALREQEEAEIAGNTLRLNSQKIKANPRTVPVPDIPSEDYSNILNTTFQYR